MRLIITSVLKQHSMRYAVRGIRATGPLLTAHGRRMPNSPTVSGEATDLPAACNCNQLRRAARRISRYYDLRLAGTGLRSTQYTLLGYLESEGPMTMAALAALLAMDRAT